MSQCRFMLRPPVLSSRGSMPSFRYGGSRIWWRGHKLTDTESTGPSPGSLGSPRNEWTNGRNSKAFWLAKLSCKNKSHFSTKSDLISEHATWHQCESGECLRLESQQNITLWQGLHSTRDKNLDKNHHTCEQHSVKVLCPLMAWFPSSGYKRKSIPGYVSDFKAPQHLHRRRATVCEFLCSAQSYPLRANVITWINICESHRLLQIVPLHTFSQQCHTRALFQHITHLFLYNKSLFTDKKAETEEFLPEQIGENGLTIRPTVRDRNDVKKHASEGFKCGPLWMFCIEISSKNRLFCHQKTN